MDPMLSAALLPGLDGLAVVPILANVGVAVLPAIIAGAASVASFLLSPRKVMALCRQRPWLPALVLLLIGLGIASAWWPAAPAPVTRSGASASAPELSGQQWMQLAQDYLAHRRALARLAASEGAAARVQAPASPVLDRTGEGDGSTIFRVDAQRSGYGGGGAPRELHQLWRTNRPGRELKFLSSVASHGDLLFAAGTELHSHGRSFGILLALDAETGRERWAVEELPGEHGDLKGFISSPALSADGRHLVIGQGLHLDRDSSLLCVDTASGAVLWVVPTPLHIEGSPAIEGDVVVAGAGAIEALGTRTVAPGDDPGFVFAVRLSTGELLWRHAVNDPESSPVLQDGIAYIGSGYNGNAVLALRARETDAELSAAGLTRELWRTPTPYPAIGAVTLAGDLLLMGCGRSDYIYSAPEPAGEVLALDRASGALRWRLELPDAVLGSIAVQGDRGYAPVRNGELVCFALADGAVLWRSVLREGALLMSGPTLAEDLIYATTVNGWLVVLDAADGRLRESHYLNVGAAAIPPLGFSSPLVADGRVYVGSETGGVLAFEGTLP